MCIQVGTHNGPAMIEAKVPERQFHASGPTLEELRLPFKALVLHRCIRVNSSEKQVFGYLEEFAPETQLAK